MKRWLKRAMVAMLLVGTASAQDMMTDVFAGKLVNPEVGVYAWYNLKDFQSDRTIFLRQAIVAKEKVKGMQGYWLEIQIVPQVGFPTTQKMLLTGPASDPKNVHKIILQEGFEPPRILELLPVDTDKPDEPDAKRESKGIEKIVIPQGALQAEHFVITRGEDSVDLWINDTVRPLGIVRLTSMHGELMLSRYGLGGKDGQSVIPEQAGSAKNAQDEAPKKKSTKDTDNAKKSKRPKQNFGGKVKPNEE